MLISIVIMGQWVEDLPKDGDAFCDVGKLTVASIVFNYCVLHAASSGAQRMHIVLKGCNKLVI